MGRWRDALRYTSKQPFPTIVVVAMLAQFHGHLPSEGREFGIRSAVGARPRQLLAMVLRPGTLGRQPWRRARTGRSHHRRAACARSAVRHSPVRTDRRRRSDVAARDIRGSDDDRASVASEQHRPGRDVTVRVVAREYRLINVQCSGAGAERHQSDPCRLFSELVDGAGGRPAPSSSIRETPGCCGRSTSSRRATRRARPTTAPRSRRMRSTCATGSR